MYRLIIPILLFLLGPGIALASSPARLGNAGDVAGAIDHHQIQASAAITIPYQFAPLDLDAPNAEPLPNVNLIDESFVNQAGSIALTLIDMFDQYRYQVGLILLVIGVMFTFWLWSIATGRSGSVALNVSRGAELGADYYDRQATAYETEADRVAKEADGLSGEFLDEHINNLRGRAVGHRRRGKTLRFGSKAVRRGRRSFKNPFK